MVNILASRMAGIKLGWVIFTLLVPIAVLGYFLNAEIQYRLETTRNEIRGAKLLHLLTPVFKAEATNTANEDAVAKLILEGPALAHSLGADNEFIAMARQINSPHSSQENRLSGIQSLVMAAHHNSNLLLDSSPETYELAAVAMQDAPAIVMAFKDMQAQINTYAGRGTASAENALRIFETAGRLQRSIDSAAERLNVAVASAANAGDYVPIKRDLLGARSMVNAQAALLRQQFIAQNLDLPAYAASVNSEAPQFIAAITDAWYLSANRLQGLLELRENVTSSRSVFMVGLSLASILIGLGSALRMFRSSLIRLDDLESSKHAAETARHDAEDMNARLTMINNEIVNLNTELADKMRRLKEAQDELLRKGRMEQLGQLTATVAHELRNPLGAVRTSAFLLERKLKDKGLGVESQLTRINNGITRCDSIITQLLDFSRTKQVAATPADFDGWLATTIEEEARRVPASVAIECTLGLEAREVPFDPARMQRAVINLISNAAEAMVGTGEDPSKFAAADPKIAISTRIEDDMAVLEVTDNGPGIASEIIEKIREPLFTTKSFGTGLGIPAVEQIVVQHGGRLEIESQPGYGAKFSIYLPLKIPQVEAA